MKLILFFLLTGFSVAAQVTNHPTINQLDVSYKEPTTPVADTLHLVRSQCTITLKADSNVTALHLKILREIDNSLLYEVNYNVFSAPVSDSDNILLFKKEGMVCYIASATMIPLSAYRYEITTEDAAGNISEVYTDIK